MSDKINFSGRISRAVFLRKEKQMAYPDGDSGMSCSRPHGKIFEFFFGTVKRIEGKSAVKSDFL